MRRRLPGVAVWCLVGVIIVSGLVATTVEVQKFRDRAYLHETLYLPSGKFLNELSLGYKQVTADFVWFSAIQYYGDYRMGTHDLAYFAGLIDIITTLDPHFVFAYLFGALVISTDLNNFDVGVDVLKKGMVHNPSSWELPFQIGFLSYVNRVSFDLAARYFDLASRMPGAPDNARRFAAFVYSKAGRSEESIKVWESYIEYTDNPLLKDLARQYIEQLKETQDDHGEGKDAH